MNTLPRSSLVRRNRSIPLNSDDFLATGFRSRFRRTSSDQFPWVLSIFNKFLVEILRNLPELFRRKLDQNPVVRKLSELNGADRKQTGSIGSVAGKQRKQSVPTVGTVDLDSVSGNPSTLLPLDLSLYIHISLLSIIIICYCLSFLILSV